MNSGAKQPIVKGSYNPRQTNLQRISLGSNRRSSSARCSLIALATALEARTA